VNKLNEIRKDITKELNSSYVKSMPASYKAAIRSGIILGIQYLSADCMDNEILMGTIRNEIMRAKRYKLSVLQLSIIRNGMRRHFGKHTVRRGPVLFGVNENEYKMVEGTNIVIQQIKEN